MSTKKPTKAELREKTLESKRKTVNFLPKYSDFYFKKKKKSKSTLSMLLGYLMILFCSLEITFDFKETFLHFGIIASITALVFLTIIYPRILDHKKICGITFAPNMAIQTNFFSTGTQLSYSIIEAAVAEGDIRLADTGIQIGHGSYKLVFHYEIGDSDAQKHIEQCYAELQRHIVTKLPPYEKKGLDLLDRRYFYEKSRRNQTISLVMSVLLFLFLFHDSMPATNAVLILAAIFCFWECKSLSLLFKSAIFTAQNNTALQKVFNGYPHMRIGKRWSGYLYFGVASTLVILINLWIILSL